jgi:hypothetical protein
VEENPKFQDGYTNDLRRRRIIQFQVYALRLRVIDSFGRETVFWTMRGVRTNFMTVGV